MLKEILKNIITKKKVIPFPAGFNVTPEQAAMIVDFQKKIDTIFKRSLRIRQIDAGSCNACEWECTALTNPIYDIQRFGIDFEGDQRLRQLVLLLPFRVQFADPADDYVVQDNLGPAPGVQCRMRNRFEARPPRRNQHLQVVLDVEEIYAALFEDAGFRNVGWKAIRKRNSKKELFEFVVHAVAP